uniref:Secreted protein n=1 Tax=Heterorhabditis bacteriophora TaxID=37862 RepID=A0A1I7WAC1_HETBA
MSATLCIYIQFIYRLLAWILKLIPCILLTVFMTLLVRMLMEARERRSRLCGGIPTGNPQVNQHINSALKCAQNKHFDKLMAVLNPLIITRLCFQRYTLPFYYMQIFITKTKSAHYINVLSSKSTEYKLKQLTGRTHYCHAYGHCSCISYHRAPPRSSWFSCRYIKAICCKILVF